ncbi:alcohol dehydrogenase catalytic domain-containing protein [Salicibibacter cibi]|uniref:alcohol dehydrogenase catalytic domain-containing protein n=1 Tax=Salicibibacter cibi TaxID=2743001 RepID=UPI0031B63707
MGHEFTGIVEEVGKNITNFKKGDRVIVPFTQGDGTCEQCLSGHHNAIICKCPVFHTGEVMENTQPFRMQI